MSKSSYLPLIIGLIAVFAICCLAISGSFSTNLREGLKCSAAMDKYPGLDTLDLCGTCGPPDKKLPPTGIQSGQHTFTLSDPPQVIATDWATTNFWGWWNNASAGSSAAWDGAHGNWDMNPVPPTKCSDIKQWKDLCPEGPPCDEEFEADLAQINTYIGQGGGINYGRVSVTHALCNAAGCEWECKPGVTCMHGQCTSEGKCACMTGYSGNDCSEPITPAQAVALGQSGSVGYGANSTSTKGAEACDRRVGAPGWAYPGSSCVHGSCAVMEDQSQGVANCVCDYGWQTNQDSLDDPDPFKQSCSAPGTPMWMIAGGEWSEMPQHLGNVGQATNISGGGGSKGGSPSPNPPSPPTPPQECPGPGQQWCKALNRCSDSSICLTSSKTKHGPTTPPPSQAPSGGGPSPPTTIPYHYHLTLGGKPDTCPPGYAWSDALVKCSLLNS